MSPPRNSRSPKFNSRSKITSPHTSPSTPSPSSSRHRHSQSLQSLQSIRSLQSIQSSPRKPPRPLLERLLSPLALSPMPSSLHSPLTTLTFESQQMQSPLPASPHKESRSERLLREALIKDDLALSQTPTPMAAQEPTLMLLGLPSPPLTRPTHRRRHSHIPVASRAVVGDVLTKVGYGYGYGAEGNGYGERRSDQKRGGRASELRDRGHDGEFRQQGYEQPLSSSPSSSSIASSLYPHSQHSYSTHHHTHSLSTPQSPKLVYGGDAEMMYPSPTPSFPPYSAFPRRTEPTLPSSEVRPHRGYSTPDVRRKVSTDPRRVDSSPNPRRGDFSRPDSPSPHPRHATRQTSTSTSTSPSPYTRQQQAPNTSSPYRPRSPALYQSSTRPHSPSPSRMHPQTPTQDQTQRSQKRQSLPANIHSALPTTPFASNQAQVQTTPGIPLPMTPHEKALRARLERVLYGNGGATLSSPDSGKIRRDNEVRPGKRERCGSNEVRDETGGWPWRERERDMVGVRFVLP
ncbi:hypothetical protein BDZ94DRAFT_1316247 [Collybia nuda]|uniref:Uncharacterized protein n=1 Tax=Collybia nuda TaxID=64659 RepID=A0A9P6CBV6_9AGAR|nr:hypothetical protein BDZ94DRAFT_1316247 [Collybia nuda]